MFRTDKRLVSKWWRAGREMRFTPKPESVYKTVHKEGACVPMEMALKYVGRGIHLNPNEGFLPTPTQILHVLSLLAWP